MPSLLFPLCLRKRSTACWQLCRAQTISAWKEASHRVLDGRSRRRLVHPTHALPIHLPFGLHDSSNCMSYCIHVSHMDPTFGTAGGPGTAAAPNGSTANASSSCKKEAGNPAAARRLRSGSVLETD